MGCFPGRFAQLFACIHDAKHNNTFGTTAFGAYALFWFGVGASWLIQMGVFGDKLATTVDPKQLAVAFLGYLIFSLYMTIGAMETHKVLFAIFVLIDFLFVGLALSTWGIMQDAMHNLAAYSELFIRYWLSIPRLCRRTRTLDELCCCRRAVRNFQESKTGQPG